MRKIKKAGVSQRVELILSSRLFAGWLMNKRPRSMVNRQAHSTRQILPSISTFVILSNVTSQDCPGTPETVGCLQSGRLTFSSKNAIVPGPGNALVVRCYFGSNNRRLEKGFRWKGCRFSSGCRKTATRMRNKGFSVSGSNQHFHACKLPKSLRATNSGLDD